MLGIISTGSAGAADRAPSEAQDPWLMGVLGDSIAAGTLADVPIPHASTPEESVRLWRDRGLESRLIYTNKKTLSWASGQEIQSHYVLLSDWLEKSGDARGLSVVNVSVPGSETGDLLGQVNQLLRSLKKGRYTGLKYVAVSIGANDACNTSLASEVPQERIHQNLFQALTRLYRGVRSLSSSLEPVRLLLVGPPRIPNLGAPAFVQAPTVFGLSCSLVRDSILRFCRPLTVWRDQGEYLDRLEVVETVNRILKSVAIELAAEFPGLQVVYSDRIFQLEIPLGALAADCFHPGRWAQEQISRQTWRDQPWFH
ncbi:hypothetical protein EBZ37_03710 [bacterium]|nr:hypothetical protein [bacterium]